MTIVSAITPPTPSTAASSSADFDMISSSVPNCLASASEAAGPRWRTPSAVRNRCSGRVREPSIAATRLAALVGPTRSSAVSWSTVSE